MVRLIQKSGFIKPGKVARYIEYIATRDGVEKIGSDGYLEYMATRPAAMDCSAASLLQIWMMC